MTTPWLVGVYLIVLMLANFLVYQFKQPALLFTGFLLVPFDFAVRVRLQENWKGPGLWSRLLALMCAGGILTVVVLPESSQIALASVSAFAAASLAGACVYSLVSGYCAIWVARASSLAAMAALDSIVFPLLAFESPSLSLMVGQFIIKWAISWAIVASKILEPARFSS